MTDSTDTTTEPATYEAVPFTIAATLTTLDVEPIDGMVPVRYAFTLYNGDNKVELLVDVPVFASDTTDVWVLDHEVAVGDTPADGFATYTRNDS